MNIKEYFGKLLYNLDKSSSPTRKEHRIEFFFQKNNISSPSNDYLKLELQKQFTVNDKDFLELIIELNDIYLKTDKYLANK